jgi:hypothetical protein
MAQRKREHFDFDSETFEVRGKTKKGQGTVNRLRMNDALQIEARKHWVYLGHFLETKSSMNGSVATLQIIIPRDRLAGCSYAPPL